jgi:prevent-host-death family protein
LTIIVTNVCLEENAMKTATVSKLKASLSEYLRRVKAGEEVLVTERGRPIAKLTPALGSDTLTERLVEMERQGLIKRGSGKLPKGFWDLPRPKDPKGSVVKAVLREREEGW